MFIHVTEAEYIDEYKVRVTFNNGQQSLVNLLPVLEGPVFEPLKDKAIFSQLKVDKVLGTIVWPNGADIAPEYIFFLAFRDNKKLEPLFRKWGYINTEASGYDSHSLVLESTQ